MTSRPKVEIYTSRDCNYCEKAKALLDKLSIDYVTLDISENEALRQQLIQRLHTARTLPQIFINGTSVGSYEDLVALIENDSPLVTSVAQNTSD